MPLTLRILADLVNHGLHCIVDIKKMTRADMICTARFLRSIEACTFTITRWDFYDDDSGTQIEAR